MVTRVTKNWHMQLLAVNRIELSVECEKHSTFERKLVGISIGWARDHEVSQLIRKVVTHSKLFHTKKFPVSLYIL